MKNEIRLNAEETILRLKRSFVLSLVSRSFLVTCFHVRDYDLVSAEKEKCALSFERRNNSRLDRIGYDSIHDRIN